MPCSRLGDRRGGRREAQTTWGILLFATNQPAHFDRWAEAGEAPAPCECGAAWYWTPAKRLRQEHDFAKHKALAHPEDRPIEPSFAEQREALKLLPAATMPYVDD